MFLRIAKIDSSISASDFARISAIENESESPYSDEILMKLLRESDNFALYYNEEIAAYMTVAVNKRYLGGNIYIVNLVTARESQGKGFAKRLMLALCRHYSGIHPELPVTLDVEKDNPAFELYKSVGFEIMDCPSRNGDTDYAMKAELAKLEKNISKILGENG